MENNILLICVAALMGLLLLNPLGKTEEVSPEYDDSIACYEGGDELVKPEFRITNLLITANIYESEGALAAAVEALGYEANNSLELAECELHPEQNIGWCEIWVVQPTTVLGDPYMDGIGHEVSHGLFGDFHE